MPFGRSNKTRAGVIFTLSEGECDGKLKSIISAADDGIVLDEEMLRLAGWLKETTFCTYYDAVRTMLPAGLSIKAEEKYKSWIERFADLEPIVVYSMWEGYLNPKHKAYNGEWKKFLDSYNHVEYMHTSGHATASLIAEVINAVEPRESIYPIHTENAKELEKLNIKEELRRRIYYGSEIQE